MYSPEREAPFTTHKSARPRTYAERGSPGRFGNTRHGNRLTLEGPRDSSRSQSGAILRAVVDVAALP
ncbi:MAG: hypothetical protein MZV63_21530 [Marinilabiliales bacterium]|nr:hypothetical protein [Marinilabiliales bacterium]